VLGLLGGGTRRTTTVARRVQLKKFAAFLGVPAFLGLAFYPLTSGPAFSGPAFSAAPDGHQARQSRRSYPCRAPACGHMRSRCAIKK